MLLTLLAWVPLASGVAIPSPWTATETVTESVSHSSMPSRSWNASKSPLLPTRSLKPESTASPWPTYTNGTVAGFSQAPRATSTASKSASSTSTSSSVGLPSPSPRPSPNVRAVLNVTLAAFSGPLGAALRCDAARAAGALLSADALSCVSVGMLNPASPWTQAPLTDSVLGNDAHTCDPVCSSVVLYRASNESTVGPLTTVNGTACANAAGCCRTASAYGGPTQGQCLAVNRTVCGNGNDPLNDASCPLSNGTFAECLPASTSSCARIVSTTVATGMCAQPSPAATVVSPPVNIVAVALDFYVRLNATVPNATFAAALIQTALSDAFSRGVGGAPAFTAALAANCRQHVVGGCAAESADPASSAAVPTVASANAVAPSPAPPAPTSGGGGASNAAGLAVGLTVLILGSIGIAFGVKKYAEYRRLKRHEEKPRRASVVDYADLHRGEFIKQTPVISSMKPFSAGGYDGGVDSRALVNNSRGVVVSNPSFRLN